MEPRKSLDPRLYVNHAERFYPYLIWFDGEPHELKQGQDYDCPTPNLRKHLYDAADSFGHRIRTRQIPGGLLIQAIGEDGQPLPPATPSAGTPAP
jgi:hypothetical protein